MEQTIQSPKVFFDVDGTLLFGPPSIGTLYKARNGIYPEINIIPEDEMGEIIDRETDRRNNLGRVLLHSAGNILINIQHSSIIRRPLSGVLDTLGTISEQIGGGNISVLSGRPADKLYLNTVSSLKTHELYPHISSLLLRPRGFMGSADWKANVINYFAKQNPEQYITLVDNDIAASISIGEKLQKQGVENARVLVPHSLETTGFAQRIARLRPLPSNVLIFKNFPELPELISQGRQI